MHPIADTPAPAALDAVRRAVLDAPADRAGDVICAELVHLLRARGAELLLVDRAGARLHRVASAGEPEPVRDHVVDGSAPGCALRRREVQRGGSAVHVPVAVRGTGHGVLTVLVPGSDPGDGVLREIGELAALLLTEAGTVTDFFEVHRRSATFSVTAELQWQSLPATSAATDRVEVHALIEPAPRVTSDLFDWSLDDDRLWLAVLDAEGRNLAAAVPAALALAALRHARRSGLPVAEQVALADQAVYDQYRGRAVVRALVVLADLDTGEVRAVRAGEPAVVPRLFRRRAGTTAELPVTEHEALGRFERSPYRAEPVDVAAGDDLLLVSDGGVAARDREGWPFGAAGVGSGGGEVLSGLPRRLLDAAVEHAGDEVTQDATALAVGWRR